MKIKCMKNRTLSVMLPLLLGLIGWSSMSAQADDWPRFRGPQGNGLSTETAWTEIRLQGMPRIDWETNVGKGHGTIVVQGNRLFTSGNKQTLTGGDTLYEDILFCLDTRTGTELWHYAYPSAYRTWPGPRTTPLVDGDRIYTLSWEGDLFALNSADGRLIWHRNLLNDSLSGRNNWGFSGSPVVEGDLLLLTAGEAGLALNKHTGAVVWKSTPEAHGLTTPVLFDWRGRRMGLFSSEQFLHAVDIATGEKQWSYEWKTCNDPVVMGDSLFLTANHNRRQTCLLRITGQEPEMLWESRLMMDWAFQNAILKDGHAYGFGNIRRDQPLQCIDMATGELKWRQDLGDFGAFIIAGDRFIILDGDGDLVIARVNAQAYEELARAKIFHMASHEGLQEQYRNYCWTEPVLAGGRIFVRDNYGALACVNVEK